MISICARLTGPALLGRGGIANEWSPGFFGLFFPPPSFLHSQRHCWKYALEFLRHESDCWPYWKFPSRSVDGQSIYPPRVPGQGTHSPSTGHADDVFIKGRDWFLSSLYLLPVRKNTHTEREREASGGLLGGTCRLLTLGYIPTLGSYCGGPWKKTRKSGKSKEKEGGKRWGGSRLVYSLPFTFSPPSFLSTPGYPRKTVPGRKTHLSHTLGVDDMSCLNIDTARLTAFARACGGTIFERGSSWYLSYLCIMSCYNIH